jgi:hypothetical protein
MSTLFPSVSPISLSLSVSLSLSLSLSLSFTHTHTQGGYGGQGKRGTEGKKKMEEYEQDPGAYLHERLNALERNLGVDEADNLAGQHHEGQPQQVEEGERRKRHLSG